MTEITIEKYKQKLDRLRSDESEFSNYCFKLNAETNRDVNQQNRFNIGVGLFNDLRIPDDYRLVQRLLDEEIKHRESWSENYDYEVIYMYFYFISEFKQVSDIWKFSSYKFNVTIDADSGFETGFLLSYGAVNLKRELDKSDHPLKEKIESKVFHYSDENYEKDGLMYKMAAIAYFGLKSPIKDPLNFYEHLNDRESFNYEFKKWISENGISDQHTAHNYVRYAEFSGSKEEMIKAIELYLSFGKKGFYYSKYKKRLFELKNIDSNEKGKKFGIFRRIYNRLKY